MSNLNSNNYYNHSTDFDWLSKSIYWNFLDCEAAAFAELNGEYVKFKNNTPLLVGNYLHSYFESEESHKEFLNKNKKSIYKYGNPEKGIKNDFKVADKMIKALSDDPTFQAVYRGEKEAIVTGNINGIKWKGKIDCLNLDGGYFCDLKTAQDLHKKFWNNDEHKWVNFAEAHGYILQMAIYRELIRQTFGKNTEPLIFAVSKQDVPDKDLYKIPHSLMDDEMNKLIETQQRVKDIIDGKVKPKHCGHCDYCRSVKQIDGSKWINDIEIY